MKCFAIKGNNKKKMRNSWRCKSTQERIVFNMREKQYVSMLMRNPINWENMQRQETGRERQVREEGI